MSNTTAATLAQNEIALVDQELPSKRLDPENNERMSVIKISRMHGHLSVEESQQPVKLVLSPNTESSDNEVWLITEKVTDEQTVLLGIINQEHQIFCPFKTSYRACSTWWC